MKKSLYVFIMLISACLLNGESYKYVSIKGLIEQEVGQHILTDIYKHIGVDVTIEPLPAKRAQMLATTGERDGEIMRIYSYGEQNPTTVRVPTPYYQLETMAFIKKDSGVVINSKDDLTKYKLVKVRGVKHTDNITAGLPNVHSSNNTEEMMMYLNKGRADVALTNTIDGKLVLKRLGYANIVPLDKPLATLDLYHYIHEKHSSLVPRVDAAIKEMEESGDLETSVTMAEELVFNALN